MVACLVDIDVDIDIYLVRQKIYKNRYRVQLTGGVMY